MQRAETASPYGEIAEKYWPDDRSWVLDNIRYLMGEIGYSTTQVAAFAGINERTLRNQFAKRDEGTVNFEMSTLIDIARALRVRPSDLLLPTEELQRKVEREGLLPFVLPRSSSASRRSSAASNRTKTGDDKVTRPKLAWLVRAA